MMSFIDVNIASRVSCEPLKQIGIDENIEFKQKNLIAKCIS